jgi:hypothetical protein
MYLLQTGSDSGIRGMFMILGLILRVIGLFYCKDKAKELNRSEGGWALFGFLSPILAMIWISCLKPVMKWEQEKKKTK